MKTFFENEIDENLKNWIFFDHFVTLINSNKFVLIRINLNNLLLICFNSSPFLLIRINSIQCSWLKSTSFILPNKPMWFQIYIRSTLSRTSFQDKCKFVFLNLNFKMATFRSVLTRLLQKSNQSIFKVYWMFILQLGLYCCNKIFLNVLSLKPYDK